PEGFLSNSLEAFAATIASSQTFQNAIAADTVQQALGEVIRGGVWETKNVPDKTRAIVRFGDGTSGSHFTNTSFTMRAVFSVMFEYVIPEAYWESYSDAYTWFLNLDGKINSEMLRNCRAQPHLYINVTEFSQVGEPGIVDPKEMEGKQVGFTTWTYEAIGENASL
ncbi:MAG TPA: hypothetical protein VLA12_03330, partial [Planctomycetaceae bacterium]|nr:hypothetical protein [Planctomycetaceae bacterium]